MQLSMLQWQSLPPLQVTTTTFTATFNLDTAGAVYYVITNLDAPSVPVQPGSAVLVSGGFGVLLSVPAPASQLVQSVTVRAEDETVDVRVPAGRRLSSSAHGQDAKVHAGTTPWHVAADTQGGYMQADRLGGVTHRCTPQIVFACSTHVCSWIYQYLLVSAELPVLLYLCSPP